MMRLKRLSTIQSSAIFFATVFLLGFGSCSNSLSDICESRLPELDRRLDAAIAALGPWVEPNRELASSNAISNAIADEGLAPMDQAAWKKWAEERLVEAQRYMDAVADPHLSGRTTRSQVREELSEIATALVSFHGYARQGKSGRMVRTLVRIRNHVAKARQLACPAG